ncbi:hypothetical protein [Azospirillum endophyticum]
MTIWPDSSALRRKVKIEFLLSLDWIHSKPEGSQSILCSGSNSQ